jgi:hypothetical protein
VTGNLFGGGTVSRSITLDQIADGGGAANDFQTELFNAAWTNLLNVDFVASGGANDWWALDNINVNQTAAVPEPATFLLLGSGLAVAAYRRRQARR